MTQPPHGDARPGAVAVDDEETPAPAQQAAATSSEAAERSAAMVLRQAELVAEELRADAERDLEEARRLRAEAQRLHDEADAYHARALTDRKRLEDELASASEEARQLVTDAGEQATLLLRAAETQRDQILASAEATARERGESSARELEAARTQAEQLLAVVGERAADHPRLGGEDGLQPAIARRNTHRDPGRTRTSVR